MLEATVVIAPPSCVSRTKLAFAGASFPTFAKRSKVADSLKKVGINKRGGKKHFNPDTIKKALANVKFG